ncbi:hypothetical protein GCM10010176_041170 [Nonomuraea spiralis]|nr:hypothetical protein GCM10010176_041170 [Nonomuraea spiralis]
MDDDLHPLSGAYAVHALPYGEWMLFERHLRGCEGCAAEVRRLRETAARLAEAVAEAPPPALRPRLLTTATRHRPPAPAQPPLLPPHSPRSHPPLPDAPPSVGTAPAAPHPPGAVLPAPGSSGGGVSEGEPGTLVLPPGVVEGARRRRGRPGTGEGKRMRRGKRTARGAAAGRGTAAAEAGATEWARGTAEVVKDGRRMSGVVKGGRGAAGVVAVAVAVACAFGVVAYAARRDLAELRVRQADLTAVLAAPDAETVREPATPGGTGTLVVSRARGRMVFTSSGLPELPRSRRYELWLMGPDGARPAGLLERTPGGITAPVLAAPGRADDRIALTIEPATGSPRPTTTPILLAALPST